MHAPHHAHPSPCMHATMHAPHHACPPPPPHMPPAMQAPSPPGQNSWDTLLKILPCPNFIAGGKNTSYIVMMFLLRISRFEWYHHIHFLCWFVSLHEIYFLVFRFWTIQYQKNMLNVCFSTMNRIYSDFTSPFNSSGTWKGSIEKDWGFTFVAEIQRPVIDPGFSRWWGQSQRWNANPLSSQPNFPSQKLHENECKLTKRNVRSWRSLTSYGPMEVDTRFSAKGTKTALESQRWAIMPFFLSTA